MLALEIRTIVQAQIIECLNRFYAIETGMWGGPLNALIIRSVVVGDLQGRLYDLSALAHVFDLPLSTVHRKITELVDDGFLTRVREGKSVYLRPTSKTCITLDKSFEDMIETVQRLYRGDPDSCEFLTHPVASEDPGIPARIRTLGE